MAKFKIGDKVHYYNGYGLYFGIKTITEVKEVWKGCSGCPDYDNNAYKTEGAVYKIHPCDTPWFWHKEKHFTLVEI